MNRQYDIAVIGAGPAGALAARQCALSGCRVVLIDKSVFPRPKVCGCCVNPWAMSTLERVGLGGLLEGLGALPVSQLRLSAAGREATLQLHGGVSISRSAMDEALIASASRAGAELRLGAAAVYDGLVSGKQRITVGKETLTARVLIVADGLGGRFLKDHPDYPVRLAPRSHIGCGTVADDAGDVPQGAIVMACGRGGYVGRVRLEDGRVDVAAAFDPAFVKAQGGPGRAAETVMTQADHSKVTGLAQCRWRGTPALTRRRPRAGERLFVAGDAAGYVEPFTGEGIAWALAGGAAVAELAVDGARGWDARLPSEWERRYYKMIQRRQWKCRFISGLLRRPGLTKTVVAALSRAPGLIRPIIEGAATPDSPKWSVKTPCNS